MAVLAAPLTPHMLSNPNVLSEPTVMSEPNWQHLAAASDVP